MDNSVTFPTIGLLQPVGRTYFAANARRDMDDDGMDLDRRGMAINRHRPSAYAGTLDPSPSGAQKGRSRIEKVAIEEAELKRKFVDLMSLEKVEKA